MSLMLITFLIMTKEKRINRAIFFFWSFVSDKIRQSTIFHFPCGNETCLTTPNEKFKLLKAIDSRKTEGFNMIPTTLVKRTAHVLYIPSSKAITEPVVRRYSSK